MKYGWLVVNSYLKSQKFDEIYSYLIQAAKDRECKLEIVTNEEILVNIKKLLNKNPRFVIFWDKDVRAAKLIELNGIRVFNSSRAIALCDDKSLTYLALADENIKMPKTLIKPLDFGIEDKNHTFIDDAIKEIKLPFVIKENCGSFGAQVHLVNSIEEAVETVNAMQGRGYIIQEFIADSRGRDIRIQMVGDEPVTAMLRENKDDFRANVTNGGRMKPYIPTQEQIQMARAVCRKLKLDFAGVDIMFGENDEPVFCEVNSNAHFKNILECTGVSVAGDIIDYVLRKGI